MRTCATRGGVRLAHPCPHGNLGTTERDERAMSRVRWDVSGTGAGRTRPPVENLALVPASLLPQKATYQRLANQLPAGVVLVVLPTEDGAEKQTLEETVRRLRTKGHLVTTLTADELRPQPRRRAAHPPTPLVSSPPPDP